MERRIVRAEGVASMAWAWSSGRRHTRKALSEDGSIGVLGEADPLDNIPIAVMGKITASCCGIAGLFENDFGSVMAAQEMRVLSSDKQRTQQSRDRENRL